MSGVTYQRVHYRPTGLLTATDNAQHVATGRKPASDAIAMQHNGIRTEICHAVPASSSV